MNTSPWFATWFDTPFYHILYKNRNDDEAQAFIDKLIDFLQPKDESLFLDLACGKGRHAIYLSKKGYDTTGVDLSKQSIDFARQFETNNLHFDTHDMRLPYRNETFDYVLNLFTSFGYFSKDKHNQDATNAMAKNLKPNGTLVIDFMNRIKVVNQLVESEEKIIDSIHFYITRKLDGKHIVKTIEFEYENHHYKFEERVEGLQLEDFERYFAHAGLDLIHVFGDYELNKFNPQNSNRLIMICQRK